MAKAQPAEARKPGARKQLPECVKFTTLLTEGHRAALLLYARAHGVSMAEAVRRAVDLLTEKSHE